jgi:hypothetical protein
VVSSTAGEVVLELLDVLAPAIVPLSSPQAKAGKPASKMVRGYRMGEGSRWRFSSI